MEIAVIGSGDVGQALGGGLARPGHRVRLGTRKDAVDGFDVAAPQARVVKAWNTVGAGLMVGPDLPDGPPSMFIGGDDADAKDVVAGLLRDVGWDVVDLGGIAASRVLEPMALAWLTTAMTSGGAPTAFRLLRGPVG